MPIKMATKSDLMKRSSTQPQLINIIVALAVFSLIQVVVSCADQEQDGCCDVVAFAAEELAADGTWSFAASMSSLYEIETGWDKYCDFFEVRTLPIGNGNYTVLGKRTFGHPHPTEQPFTRRVRGVLVPAGIDRLVAVAHDTVNGFCGSDLILLLSGSEPTSVTAPPSTPSPVTPTATPAVQSSAPTDAPVTPTTESPITNSPDNFSPTNDAEETMAPAAPFTLTHNTSAPITTTTAAPIDAPPTSDPPSMLPDSFLTPSDSPTFKSASPSTLPSQSASQSFRHPSTRFSFSIGGTIAIATVVAFFL
jgi:hypothetical protein